MKLILLDSLSRRSLAVRVLLWIFTVSLFVCLGMTGPKSLRRFRFSAYDCDDPMQPFDPAHCKGVQMSKGSVWKHNLKSLSAQNQYLILEFGANNTNFEGMEEYAKELYVTVSLFGSNSPDEIMSPVFTNVTHRRKLVCREDHVWCDKIPVLHVAWLQYSNYEIHVDFHQTQHIEFIGDVAFQFATVNTQYTEFTIIVKWLYILITVQAIALYRRKIAKLDKDKLMPPQRWIMSLLVALLFFNDPFCLLGVIGGLQPSWIVPLLSTLCQVSFVFLLLLFWIVILDNLKKGSDLEDESESVCGEVFKYILVFVAWLATCGLLTWLRMHQVNDPTLTFMSDFPYFDIFLDLTITIAGVYVFWLLHLILQARSELDVDQPEYRRFYTTLFLSLCLVAFFVFGSIGGVVPYIAEGELTHTKGWHFSAMHGLVNWFCFFMAYLFAPCTDANDNVFDALYKDRGSFPGEL